MSLLTLFLKVICLQGRFSKTTVVNFIPELDGLILKEIFSYIRSLLPTPNFPFMIYPAQIV
jgi:hypothetical protein